MQVSETHDVKVYNLSSGKSLPEWLSEKKRRALLKKDGDLKRRIELIQDFDMPGLSNSVRVSKDGQYIMATGIYKPRIKCFDVNNLSLKFERCFDSEAVTFEILSDDYSKLIFLQCDRYIELHVAHGRHYRVRIPKFGRDMKYHYPTAEVYVVGTSPEIYRLNLERGQFMTPLVSDASTINKCVVNTYHNLFLCGTEEGRVEAWDPRSKELAGKLDCAFSCVQEHKSMNGFPSITALNCDGPLHLGVGTATGQVMLYDIRSNKPYFVKDHAKEGPIKDIDFNNKMNIVYSMDEELLTLWDKNTGKTHTLIEAATAFNNLCVVPDTGLLFIANENTKIQTYYIPSVGPAPKWASFLDSLTEELEESNIETTYDDYKLVTRQELELLGLEHLIGTNMLRAHMHGYFIDVRLYRKARSVADPFAFEEYKKKKIRETIENDRATRVQIDKLPRVNKELALKFMGLTGNVNKKKHVQANLLEDDRFKPLFTNPNYEIDKNTEEYRLLNPVLAKLDKSKQKEQKKKPVEEIQVEEEDDEDGKSSDDFASEDEEEDESSDDDVVWTKEVKKQHKLIQKERRIKDRMEEEKDFEENTRDEYQEPKLIALQPGDQFDATGNLKRRLNNTPFGERLQMDDANVKFVGSIGNREMTFSTKRKSRDTALDERNKKHRDERKALVRPTRGMRGKSGGKFFKRR